MTRKRIWYATSMLVALACTTAKVQDATAGNTDARVMQQHSTQAAVNELLAADRAFSAASMKTDLVTGISAMFRPDVAMGVGGKFAMSSAEVVESLRNSPANLTSHAEWTPIRGGISADGRQGFTLGYMTVHKADNGIATFKYLSYWIKGSDGWRVAAYKRRPRADDEMPSLAMQPAALPDRMLPVNKNAKEIETLRASLDDAERSFSRDAQSIGLSAAFARWGTLDSYNMGAQTNKTWVVGSKNIGEAVATGEPATGSSVYWAPDRVIIASTGDLGVTIGYVRLHEKPTDGSAGAFPFFTVWRRPNASSEWHYVAE